MVGSGGGEGFAGEDLEAELTMYRSGSAPPTVEGSLTAVGGASSGFGFASEEEIRSDPDYVSYYYTHVKLNPRLPPPTLSKEEWVSTKRVVGGIGDRRKPSRVEEGIGNLGLAGDWSCRGDGLMGLSLEREKSFTDILQVILSSITFLLNFLVIFKNYICGCSYYASPYTHFFNSGVEM